MELLEDNATIHTLNLCSDVCVEVSDRDNELTGFSFRWIMNAITICPITHLYLDNAQFVLLRGIQR